MSTGRWDQARAKRTGANRVPIIGWTCLYKKCGKILPAGRVAYCDDACRDNDQAERKLNRRAAGADRSPRPAE